jgi:hypothetical protein
MADALSDERRELEKFNDLLQTWHDNLLRDIPDTDRPALGDDDFYARWRQTTGSWSTSISRQMPLALDPEEVAEMRGDLVEILGVVTDYDAERPLDSVDSVMVHLEAIRHVVRDAIDGHVTPDGDARALLRGLEAKLPRITRKDLARLIGTSDRSIQRTLKSEQQVEPSWRLLVVARLVELLRRAWTPEGVVAWFFRPRPEWDGVAPLDLLEDPSSEQRLMSAAKQGRAQHGS